MRAPRLPRAGGGALAPLLALALSLAGGGRPAAAAGPPPAAEWTEFEGTWSAVGQRRTLRAGAREAATIHLSGSLVVARGEGLRKGFRAEAIGYDDGAGTGVGVMVLTDDRGDQVFCDLTGSASERGRLVVGTITGGTGSYAGISGDLSFRWQQLTKAAEGEVQGLAVSLRGRYRRSAPAAAPTPPAPEAPR